MRMLLPAMFLPLLMLQAACGFTPVYQQTSSTQADSARAALAQIRIQTPDTRQGDLMKAAIEDHFYQSLTVGAQTRYVLQIDLQINQSDFMINPDGLATRADMHLLSPFQLKDTATGELLHTGKLRRHVSYNLSERNDYATYVAQKDAIRRVIEAVARDYALEIGAFMSRRTMAHAQ
jgi:LPS-assembly lipoprotein